MHGVLYVAVKKYEGNVFDKLQIATQNEFPFLIFS